MRRTQEHPPVPRQRLEVERLDPKPLQGARPREERALHLFIGAFMLASSLALPLRAHNILTSWAEARVTADRLEITLTLARASAQALRPDAQKLPPITPENFAEYAPHLRAAAPELFQIWAAGKPLVLTSAEVAIDGDDLNFKLAYPRPAGGPLRFFAYYLGYLVDGHVATLVVSNASGDDLGWSPLTMDQPVFQIALPPAAAPPAQRKSKDGK